MDGGPLWCDAPHLGGSHKRSAGSKPPWGTSQVHIPKRGNEAKLMNNPKQKEHFYKALMWHVWDPAMGQLIIGFELRELQLAQMPFGADSNSVVILWTVV